MTKEFFVKLYALSKKNGDSELKAFTKEDANFDKYCIFFLTTVSLFLLFFILDDIKNFENLISNKINQNSKIIDLSIYFLISSFIGFIISIIFDKLNIKFTKEVYKRKNIVLLKEKEEIDNILKKYKIENSQASYNAIYNTINLLMNKKIIVYKDNCNFEFNIKTQKFFDIVKKQIKIINNI